MAGIKRWKKKEGERIKKTKERKEKEEFVGRSYPRKTMKQGGDLADWKIING